MESTKSLFLIFILTWTIGYQSCAQTHSDINTSTLVENADFDQTIKSYIDFTIPLISVDSLFNSLDDYNILDAREKPEFLISHIKNAKHIGYDSPDFTVLKDMDKESPIVIYCSIGYRSEKIGEVLKEKGFTVFNLYGSIFEWANKAYPLFDQYNQNTHLIHGYNKSWSKWIENKTYKITY